MEVGKEIDINFLKHLKNCFSSPSMHNIKFIIGAEGQEFKCNGTALAIVSPKIRELLFSKSKQCKTQVVLPTITPAGFAIVVRSAFALDPKISPENVVEAIHAAAECEVEVLHKLAMEYMSNILSNYPEDYLVVFLEQANQFGLRVVVSMCMKSLEGFGGVKHFLSTKQFTEFPPEFVSLLLSCDELSIEEEDLWECILNWAKKQAERKNKEIVVMLKLVYHKMRFPLMSTKYFSSAVVPTGVLSQQEMINLFCYLTNPEGEPETSPFSSSPRILWDNIMVRRYSECASKQKKHIHEEGSIDCIGVEVDHKCQLQAVGTFVGKGVTKCRVGIYEVEGDQRDLVGKKDDAEIEMEECSTDAIRLELQEPVSMHPDRIYEIEIHQTGPPSRRIKDGKAVVNESRNEVEVCFRWHKAGVDSLTSVKKGNIPCIWVRVLSGRLCNLK